LVSMLAAVLAAMAILVGGIIHAAVGAIESAASVSSTADHIDPPQPTTTKYRLPVTDTDRSCWNPTRAAYPATDIFLACGAELVSPVSGIIADVRTVDAWNPTIDDPATRGGRSVAIVGFDQVRYYLAHFDQVEPNLVVGAQIHIGDRLGTMGDTGRTSACHTHFGISPPCDGDEWAVRRGVIWPYPYLDAWRNGQQLSPATEIAQWELDNPSGCAEAIARN
jgi:murein DD-endopeptidase MepM/ murein hydrolase activator NlpD